LFIRCWGWGRRKEAREKTRAFSNLDNVLGRVKITVKMAGDIFVGEEEKGGSGGNSGGTFNSSGSKGRRGKRED